MAKAKVKTTDKPTVEEMHFRSDNAYLCMLLNRRTSTIRVIDFRSGALSAKRLYIQMVALQEGVEKVITLVEKDEVSSWTRVGFQREGQIPGFYKRSDGHLLGCVINNKMGSLEVDDAGARLAERTVNAARKVASKIKEPIKGVNLKVVSEEVAMNARDKAWSKGQAVGTFDQFGRGVERIFLETKPVRGSANYVAAEYQDCFGHALIEVLRTPKDDAEIVAACGALRVFAEELKKRGIISAFGFAASDDVGLASAYAGAGFRKTGLLAQGVKVNGERKDAILWTRKLAIPGEEDEKN